MNGQQIIKLFYTSGITILRDVYDCSPYDLADGLMPLNTARKYTRLADVLFGLADSPKVQRDSVALAEQRQLSLKYLEMATKPAKNPTARGAGWNPRAELIPFEAPSKKSKPTPRNASPNKAATPKRNPGCVSAASSTAFAPLVSPIPNVVLPI